MNNFELAVAGANVPKVYVITLNWNGAEDSIACVKSLLKLAYANFRIVICDNASRPDSVRKLQRWCYNLGEEFAEFNSCHAASNSETDARVVLIHTGGNLGYAGGMNVGMRYALARGDFEFVWILNNDTEVDSKALTALVNRSLSDRTIGICGSTLVLFHERNKIQAFGGASYQPEKARSSAIGAFSNTEDIPNNPSDVESRMAYVIGASMLVRKAFMIEIGLMDESYFLYSEEHDWAVRGSERFRLGYAPDSIVYHKHGGTIGTSATGGSTLSLFYLYRSKLAFTRRHHKDMTFPLYWLIWDGIKYFLKGHPKKAVAVWRGLLAERALSTRIVERESL